MKAHILNGLKGFFEGLAPTKIIRNIGAILAKLIEAIKNSRVQVDTGGDEVRVK